MFVRRKSICLGLACCLGICLLWAGCEFPNVAEAPDKPGTVDVVIDYNGRKPTQEFQVQINENSTVLAVLGMAQETGEITFDFRGDGTRAFVSAIGGVANEKAAGDNWTFRVNDVLGDRSCGVFQVKAGDQILWLFGKYP